MAFIRHHMHRGQPVALPFGVRFRKPRASKQARAAFLLAALQQSRRPLKGGRMRALSAAGDPFRFRLPKVLRKLTLGKVLKVAAPVVGTVIAPGIGTALGAAASKYLPSVAAAVQKFGPQLTDLAGQLGSTLTGPGAPGQDYHDQVPGGAAATMPMPVYTTPTVEVTPEDTDQGEAFDVEPGQDLDQDQENEQQLQLEQLLALFQ